MPHKRDYRQMRVIARGRPPKAKHYTVRMTRSTKIRLQYLARHTGWTQGRVIEEGLKLLYKADDV